MHAHLCRVSGVKPTYSNQVFRRYLNLSPRTKKPSPITSALILTCNGSVLGGVSWGGDYGGGQGCGVVGLGLA